MANIDDLLEVLQDAKTLRQERDELAEKLQKSEDHIERLSDNLKRLERVMEEKETAKAEEPVKGSKVAAIDDVIDDLYFSQNIPAPVGPLIEACISVLRASKILLEAVEKKL